MRKSTARRIFIYLLLSAFAAIGGIVVWGGYLTWEVRQWDEKIAALCAAKGGRDVATRIYMTVPAPLTKEYFSTLDPPALFFIPERLRGRDLGVKYPYVIETRVVQVLNDKNPSVVKFSEQIVRVVDSKILAERFGYQRAGGGIPGLEPGEIRVCPTMTTEKRLDVQVFENHPYHKDRE